MRHDCKTCPYHPFLSREERRAREERRERHWFRLLWIDVSDLVLPGRRVSLR